MTKISPLRAKAIAQDHQAADPALTRAEALNLVAAENGYRCWEALLAANADDPALALHDALKGAGLRFPSGEAAALDLMMRGGGAVLICGATGSGKTAAAVKALRSAPGAFGTVCVLTDAPADYATAGSESQQVSRMRPEHAARVFRKKADLVVLDPLVRSGEHEFLLAELLLTEHRVIGVMHGARTEIRARVVAWAGGLTERILVTETARSARKQRRQG